jgi:hypothetical protein
MMRGSKMLILTILLPAGCISTPPSDNPFLVRNDAQIENPILIAPVQPSDTAYADVFEKVLNVVEDYFKIDYAQIYDGTIICAPKTAPGFDQLWKLGSPDLRERMLATFQSMRFRCIVKIRTAGEKGYLVQVTVFRELEDLPRPIIAPNSSVFRDASTVDRSFEVVDPVIPTDGRWIPKGRDTALEDAILKKIRKCQ